jgi:hypothetical protein
LNETTHSVLSELSYETRFDPGRLEHRSPRCVLDRLGGLDRALRDNSRGLAADQELIGAAHGVLAGDVDDDLRRRH